jgi:REP element-mobilizing transposase RayT
VTLFNNKYRIESARLKGYDYASQGEYFITICTGGMVEYFGNVVNDEMKRNDIGEIVAKEWQRTQEIRKIVVLDEWVVMPNHFHGIICIVEKSLVETTRRVVSNKPQQSKSFKLETSQRDVSTRKLKPNSLGSIIGQFKSITTKRIHANGYPDFSWQPRFYDHIIRDEKGLNAIREYIHNNPAQWEFDQNDPSGLYNWNPNDTRLQRTNIN